MKEEDREKVQSTCRPSTIVEIKHKTCSGADKFCILDYCTPKEWKFVFVTSTLMKGKASIQLSSRYQLSTNPWNILSQSGYDTPRNNQYGYRARFSC